MLGIYINILAHIAPKKATALAYRYFSEPRDGRLLKEELPPVLKEAEEEMVTHGDFVFQMYTWKGGENTVLLVHGWESNASRWENFLIHLKRSGSTIIALDAPAHGLSSGTEFTIPRYAEFIDVIVRKFRPQSLVGHSIGGATILYYQSHYANDSVEKMVVLGAPCDFNTVLSNYAGMLSLNSKVLLLLKKHFFDHFSIDTDDFCGDLFASKIRVKALLAHDRDDAVVSYKEGRKIADAWPEAEFITTNGLGHSMHDESLYRRIYQFLFT
ncbi:alpha/beta hydrolase [uncultured Flavobacterium sp.]|uniref:alpha/beta fold hydrolase n=1 Tax=uncultured Flavobacterium sp. TaxID=165435 RepID=UPI0025D5DE5A|nr:alpha/beta hydrolase [uncultured Flavobacterium sp.]